MKRVILGGTGFYDMDFLESPYPQVVRTPFGSATVFIGQYQGEEIGFLPRHGPEHNFLAHQVNYQANIWALRELGVERILGTSAVGGISPHLKPGQLVVPDQLVDFCHSRKDTFNLGSVDITDPYCPEERQIIMAQSEKLDIDVESKSTYLALDGPSYRTAAEIKLWQGLGMDIAGMTNGTEAALARELGICYAIICMPTNLCSGLQDERPDLETHRQAIQDNLPLLRKLTLAALMALPVDLSCPCASQAAQPIR